MKRPCVVVPLDRADDLSLIAAQVSREVRVPIEVKVNRWLPSDVAIVFDLDGVEFDGKLDFSIDLPSIERKPLFKKIIIPFV